MFTIALYNIFRRVPHTTDKEAKAAVADVASANLAGKDLV